MIDLLPYCLGKLSLETVLSHERAMVEAAERAHILAKIPINEQFSDGTRARYKNAHAKAAADARMLRFEADRLVRALRDTDAAPIVLKGGAYIFSGGTVAEGRRVSDLDILVRRDEVGAVESALRAAGFVDHDKASDDFTQRYYRRHMHELPPLMHAGRRTVIDVHHNLVPPMGRVRLNLDKMREAALPLPRVGLYAFTPVDQFLHAALHALYDGEWDTPERSTLDLAQLYEALSTSEKAVLSDRADALGLARPLSAVAALLASINIDVEDRAGAGRIIGRIAAEAIQSGSIKRQIIQAFFRLRGHWLRMPLWSLVHYAVSKLIWRVSNQGSKEPRSH